MEAITYSKVENVCTITFNRPKKLNAINSEMYRKLPLFLNRAAGDDDISVVVLTGAGKYYTAGNDFVDINPDGLPVDELKTFSNLVFSTFTKAFIDFPKCLVAAVNGPVIGAGATTLALCDYVYFSDSAWLLCPFGRLALVPEGCASLTFPKIFGPMLAREILLQNRRMSAAECLQHGLANEVFPNEEFQERLNKRVSDLAKLPPKFLTECKQLLRAVELDALHAANRRECALLYSRSGSDEQLKALSENFRNKKSKL